MENNRCYGIFRVAINGEGQEVAWSISGNLTAGEASIARDEASQQVPAHAKYWIECRRLV